MQKKCSKWQKQMYFIFDIWKKSSVAYRIKETTFKWTQTQVYIGNLEKLNIFKLDKFVTTNESDPCLFAKQKAQSYAI